MEIYIIENLPRFLNLKFDTLAHIAHICTLLRETAAAQTKIEHVLCVISKLSIFKE